MFFSIQTHGYLFNYITNFMEKQSNVNFDMIDLQKMTNELLLKLKQI